MFHRLRKSFGRPVLIALAAAVALLIVPASQAFAAPTFKLNIVGTGSGAIESVEEFPYEPGTPPIACSYDGTSASGVCENEPELSAPPATYGIALLATAAPGSELAGWTIQKGNPDSVSTCPYPGEEQYCIMYGNSGQEELEATAIFCTAGSGGECTFPLHVAVIGNGGSVSSSPAGISCSAGQECEAEVSNGVVTLTAAPPTGYTVGWLGCTPTGALTCEVTGDTEKENVSAYFLKEGTQGTPGAAGTPGKTGATGAQGPSGSNGGQGPAGANGAPGPIGATGPQGPAGPAGKVKVTCKVEGKKVKCVVKTVNQSGAKRAARSQRLRWRLMQGGHSLSHGNTNVHRLQTVLNHLRPGNYALHIAGQRGSTSIEVG